MKMQNMTRDKTTKKKKKTLQEFSKPPGVVRGGVSNKKKHALEDNLLH